MTNQESFVHKLVRRLGYVRYVVKPAMWPELARRLKYKISHSQDEERRNASLREEAIAWCRTLACSTTEALESIFNSSDAFRSLSEEHPDVINEAENRVRECPVKMGGAGNLDLLYSLCERLQVSSVLETGVAYGWSSLAVLLSMNDRNTGSLYSIDLPYFELNNDRWVGVVVPESLRSYWTLFRMADREGVPKAIASAQQFDLVHYDSDKSYEGRMKSYGLVWDALRTGGIFVSDDIGDNTAFRDFCRDIDIKPTIIEFKSKYQGILIKP